MHARMLDLLRCPYCGGALAVAENACLRREHEEIAAGVLCCECCAYPIVDGIPVIIADRTTESAMHELEAGRTEAALFTLLRLDEQRQAEFRAFLGRGEAMTYREGADILGRHEEGLYFLYRFSDPTYRVAQAVVRAIGGNVPCAAGRALDACGGSGHLTRELCRMATGDTVLTDLHFWKLWLARRFTAPSSEPVCCDGNAPLPFTRDSFSLVVCSDAFHYIWCKRLLAGEMERLAGGSGTIVLTHLHSALGSNASAGMPLTPQGYGNLFETRETRLFAESELLNGLVGSESIDLGRLETAASWEHESSLTLVSSPHADVFRRYHPADLRREVEGELVLNPLYRAEQGPGGMALSVTYPSADYEEEYAAIKRYLPQTLTLDLDARLRPRADMPEAERTRLMRLSVLLDVPKHYC